ncbi:AAA family ATPase [Ideonella paludis]|uniref:AAA family ATPase n=1 Tax=Ideonella paludis TaxID=1233411 RepID=A0ABS5DZY0_9BURK|nr:AAA family ATPase [Ideonella paludis]MBQ0936723.1 AAA family ATPase [Ideonella paludis]
MSNPADNPVQIAVAGTDLVCPAPSFYSEQDRAAAKEIIAWLQARDLPRSWLAKKTKISSSTVSQVLNQKYPSSPSSYLAEMLAIVHLEAERLGDGTPGYVKGSVHKLVFVVCDRTRKHANFGVVCGRVGVGKTRTLKEYWREKPQTLLIESNPRMTAKSLLLELHGQLGIPTAISVDQMFNNVVKALKDTHYLLIVDEAESLNDTALHYVRRIRDKAEIGTVLVGTEKLMQLLKPETGQFDQIRSRVSMWPETVKCITRDDADAMATEALAEFGDVPDDVLDTLWAYCAGSARMLMESLVPAIKDYGSGKALSAQLVEAVATKVLFMRPLSQAAKAGRAA